MITSCRHRLGVTFAVAVLLFVLSATPWSVGAARANETLTATVDSTGTASVAIEGSEYLVSDQNGAQLLVQRHVDAAGTVSLKGTGWSTTDGTPSTIAIKLNYTLTDGTSGTYQRTGDSVVRHPVNNNLEPTIWVLFTADGDGSFERTIDAPGNLQAGQRLVINAASGLTGDPDVQRSITSAPLTVGGVEWGGDTGEVVECVPSTPTAQYSVATEPNADGSLTISGTGWCNQISGGSVIAIKIDDGAYQRLNTNINDNRTIWTLIDADPHTGDWSTNLVLPDGTTSGPNGSEPAFTTGQHTIRMLTGSLKEGDPIRSYPSRGVSDTSFVVGEYSPSGVPDPVDYDTMLTDATRGGVDALYRESAGTLRITVPGAAEGSWVYVSVYREDSSARWPWNQWYQLDSAGRLTLDTSGTALPVGTLKVVVQSGDQGRIGELIGWDSITVSESSTDTTSQPDSLTAAIGGFGTALALLGTTVDSARPTTPAPVSAVEEVEEVVVTIGGTPAATTAQSASVPRVNAAQAVASTSGVPQVSTVASNGGATQQPATPQPTTTPDAPVPSAQDLVTGNVGSIISTRNGTDLDITLGDREPGEWVYLYLYSPNEDPKGLGWIQISDTKQIGVNAEGLGAGLHKFAITDEAGELIGWTDIDLAADGTAVDEGDTVVSGGAPGTVPLVAASAPLMRGADWALIIGSIAIVELAAIGLIVGRRRVPVRSLHTRNENNNGS
jgi:hypothetical protein